MHDDSDTIASLQQLLTVYRRTIEYLELQRAQFGAFTPVHVWHQFDDARTAIARIKRQLRDQGAPVEDLPGDQADQTTRGHPANSQELLRTYRRMLIDQLRLPSLAGLNLQAGLYPQLADVYVDRTLAPLRLSLGARGQGDSQQTATATLFDLAQGRGARLLLEGQLGSGKSTAIAALALACAAHGLGEPEVAPELAASWPGPPPLPILLDAGEIAIALGRADAAPADAHLPSLAIFWEAIENWLRYAELQALVPTFQLALEQGGCLVLIDDFDNLPAGASLQAFATALSRFVARYPNNRYVVTCRSAGPTLTDTLVSFSHYSFAPLTDAQTGALIGRWYAVCAQREGSLILDDSAERSKRLEGAVRWDEGLQTLAETPLGLVLCVMTHADGHPLPSERGALLRRTCDVLLNSWGRQRAGTAGLRSSLVPDTALAAVERRLALVERMGLAFQSRAELDPDRQPVLRRSEIEQLLLQTLGTPSVERRRSGGEAVTRLLAHCCHHGLLAPVGGDSFVLPHRPVREYLAARALASRPDFLECTRLLTSDSHWRQTLLLAVHELGRGPSSHLARALIAQLLARPNDAGSRSDLLLAAEGFLELGRRVPADEGTRATLQRRLLGLLDAPGEEITTRVMAGRLLGRLGDPRLTGLIPKLAEVPGGRALIGSDEDYEDEGPAQWVELPDFKIGVYPVTNHEYAVFLAERQGPLRRPRYWYDPRFNNPAQPVVGVTWYDANDYCAWLTVQLQRAALIPPELVVRLPIEVEWEKAVCWDPAAQRRRRYPWGDEWVSGCANTLEGRSAWYTTPVGCYPGGVSPYGLLDCIGNVWEWTASPYVSYPGAAAPFFEPGRYVLRGHSCASLPTHARASYRSRLVAGNWRYHLGFRIVVAWPVESLPEACSPWCMAGEEPPGRGAA